MRHSIVWLLAGLGGCGTTGEPTDPPLLRLTPTEYNNTVRDLLGVAPGAEWPETGDGDEEEDEDATVGAWPWRFPADVPIHGFEGMAEGQVASTYLIEQFQKAAEHFSRYALDAPVFWTCPERARCAEDSVVRFAQRAWRRPLTHDERARLTAFSEQQVRAQGVDAGTRLAVMAILQSPQFLYRVEAPVPADVTRAVKLDAFELASRLSYLLWDSMPDSALFEAAATGGLESRAGVERQVRRMLQDPRARTAIVRFHEQWLGLGAVYSNRASLAAYAPRYLHGPSEEEGGELANEGFEEVWATFLIGAQRSMEREAQLFIENTVFEGPGTLGELLTDHHGYATQFDDGRGTMGLYGVTEADVLPRETVSEETDDGNIRYGFTHIPVTYPEHQRSGVLTLGATLAALSHPVHPAPILRGVFVLERLACENVGQPPDDAALQAPPDSVSADATNRERVQSITAVAPCASCHDRINPLGFAFENYDSLGGWRDRDNGRPIDASGVLQLSGEPVRTFTNAVGLGQALATSDRVHDCYAQHWTRYAFGTEVATTDPTLTELQFRFKNRHKGKVLELIVDITTSEAFRYRSAGPRE